MTFCHLLMHFLMKLRDCLLILDNAVAANWIRRTFVEVIFSKFFKFSIAIDDRGYALSDHQIHFLLFFRMLSKWHQDYRLVHGTHEANLKGRTIIQLIHII